MPVDARELSRLPISDDPWEVEILDVPDVGDGAGPREWLVVLETSSGALRWDGPLPVGGSLREALGEAMLATTNYSWPARPRLLRCGSEPVRRRVAAECPVGRVAVKVGSVDLIVDLLSDSVQVDPDGPPVPGLDDDVPAWASALRAFAAEAPWRTVRSEVLFHFQGGPPALSDVELVITGLDEERVGIMVFLRDEDVGEDDSADDLFAGVDFFEVVLYPVRGRDPAELARCAAQGLLLPGGWVPHGYVGNPAGEPLGPERERLLRTALEAVMDLWRAHGAAVAEGPCAHTAETSLGTVQVTSSPPTDWEE